MVPIGSLGLVLLLLLLWMNNLDLILVGCKIVLVLNKLMPWYILMANTFLRPLGCKNWVSFHIESVYFESYYYSLIVLRNFLILS